jgi:type II secretory ATPase GspE/PulE/Tfp pilus assembly ATPase PilB-like protein
MDKAKSWDDVPFYKSAGCDKCGGEGYHGRTGIYEVLPMSTAVRKLVTQTAATEEIEKQAKEEGMATMAEDGFVKIVQGMTSLEEVLRATKE